MRSLVGRPVGVRLADGTEYRGVLVCVDGFMNVAMEQAEEYTDGSLKAKLGDCFIRGNNGEFFLTTLCVFVLCVEGDGR